MTDGNGQAFPSGIKAVIPPTYLGGQPEIVYPHMGMTIRQYTAIHIGAALVSAGLRSGQDMSQLDKIAVEFADKLLARL